METFISRDSAIQQLSRVRYPGKQRHINPSTFWRWCKLAQVDATTQFNAEEFGRLHRVAQLAFRGLNYQQITNQLGITSTHDSNTPKATSTTSGSRSASGSIPTGLDFLYRD